MRDIAIVTVGRSDWGIYRSLLRGLAGEREVRLRVLASGMHLAPHFGETIRDVEAAALGEVERVPMSLSGDTAQGIAQAMSEGVASFSRSYARHRPDLLVVLGDRFEMFSAAVAAVPFLVPIAHLHGGERTEGAIDEVFRHAMTKMSHLHFVSTEEYGARVRQLGEEAWRVVVSGAPALDTLASTALLSPETLRARIDFDVARPFLLCTFHPVTLEPAHVRAQGEALLAALDDVALPVLFTMPNADPGGRILREQIQSFVAARPAHRAVEALGIEAYASVLARAAAMVGNSSSGLIEAPHYQIPVVNIGSRQDGRVRGRNVIDVAATREAITKGIRQALVPAMREELRALVSPYGGGDAAPKIVRALVTTPLDDRLLRKRFVDAGEV